MDEFFDASNVNGHIDWHAARLWFEKRKLKPRAIVKASEGTGFDDWLLHENVQHGHDEGFELGFYHFARPDLNDAKAEADHFLGCVHGLEHELVHVLDWETHAHERSPRQMVAWEQEWLARVKAIGGGRPALYTYPSFWTVDCGNDKTTAKLGYPLWLASYGPNDGRDHGYKTVGGWAHAAAHQFTSNGSVDGVHGRVDLDFAESLGLLMVKPPVALHNPAVDNPAVEVDGPHGNKIIAHQPLKAVESRLGKILHGFSSVTVKKAD